MGWRVRKYLKVAVLEGEEVLEGGWVGWWGSTWWGST